MTKPDPKPDPDTLEHILRRKTAHLAIEFGFALLSAPQKPDGVVSFGTILDIAAQWVIERPNDAATYFAALVAIDMAKSHEKPEADRRAPSVN